MAKKNALQSALDLVKSGALKTMAATPIGQFATKVGQAASFLRAPSMEDLGSAYNQSVGRVSSFVQKYPSPASYVQQRMPQVSLPQTPYTNQVQSSLRSLGDTYKENMRLLSNPVKSLTTETPAARFLFEKIGGPGQYGEINGPPTVGKYIASNIEQSLPGLLPMYGGKFTQGANILKQGINVPAMMRMGSGFSAFNAALTALKGEKVNPQDIASSFAMGAIFGIAEPKPMSGLAKTDLSIARKVLGEYGFKLSDYENSTLLKTKFRKNILKLHPDKGGDPEVFKSFVDAYNKATSAGVDSSWKFPDVMAWIRNLWTKKQKPTGGTMMKIGQPAPTTATEGLFGKIANAVQQEAGVGFHTFEGSQIRAILKKVGLDKIPEGTVETPEFIVQYIKKSPVTGQPIPPRLVVNLFQEAQPSAQAVAPQIVPQPPVQPVTPVPQVLKTQPQPITQAIEEKPATFYEALKKNPYKEYSESKLPAGNTFDLGNGIKAELTAREHTPEGMVLENNSPNAKEWYLERITSTNQGKGNASKALDGLLKLADEYGITLKVEPRTYGKIKGLTTEQLQAWYQKRGFVPDEGIYWKRVPSSGGEGGLPITPADNETPSTALLDHFREAARTVNVDELTRLNGMSIADQNRYVEQLNQNQPATVTTGTQAPIINGAEGITPTVSDEVYQVTIKNGGATVDLAGNQPNQGFSYSPYPELQTIVLGNKFASRDVDAFIDKNIKLLQQSGRRVGTWIKKETGEVYLDVVVVGPPTGKTLQNAMNARQEAVFDLASIEGGWDGEITIGKFDKEVYNPIDEATNIFNQYRGKISQGDKSAGVAGIPEVSQSGSTGIATDTSVQSQPTAQQVTPPIPQASPVQPAVMAPVVPSTPVPQVPTTPPLKETTEKKMYGFTKNVLKYDTATEEFKQKILGEIKDHYYQVLHNKDVVEEAQQMIAENKDETLKRVLNVNDLDTTLNAVGEILEYQAQHEGDLVLADKIHLVLAEKGLRAGQQGQIFRIWAGMTPEGRLHFADKLIRTAKDKMSQLDKLANKTSMTEEAPKVAQKLGEELNKANLKTLDTVLKDVKQKAKDIKRKTTEQGTEISSEELLGERVIRYVKSLLTSPTKEQNPIKIMVDTLYKVALEVLPKKTPLKKDPLQFISEAIKDKEGYGEAWNLARDIVGEKFVDNPKALAHLDDYFAHILNRPFAQAQLNQAVATRLKEGKIDITEVVRDYYVEKQKLTGETLATRLSQEAGLTDEDARMLEDYVTKRFAELTKTKKEQILASMMKEIPQLAKHKTFIQKIIEASNLGAFNDRKYYDMLAMRFNIPNISEELAHQIYTMTQNIQTLVPGTERDKQVQSVMNLVSDQLPLGFVDIWDAYRKNNMLSGPGSNMRNAYSNTLVTSLLVPLNLMNMVIDDAFYSTLKGKERQFYASMVPSYIKSSISSIPLAVDRFKAAWRGEMTSDDPTLKELNYLRIRRSFPKLSIPTRFLEAADQLFQTTISEGVSAALQSNGMTKEQADEYGLRIAKQELFKSPLDPENKTDQGKWMAAIDKATTGLLQIRTGFKPVDWILPFVVVPALWAKQAIRYTAPLGTLIQFQIKDPVMRNYQRGATKTGLTFLLISAAFAIKGLSEWEGEKKDETLRTAGYDSGKRDYSIKIGNAWVPLWYFGPLFFSMALPIAIRHYWTTSRTAKTDSDIKKIARVGLGLSKAFTSATFLRGIGDFFKILNGELDSSWSQYAANLASQNIYYSGLLRWMSMLADDTYRRSNTFYDAIKKGIPFWSKTLEPYYTLKGEQSKRNASAALTPYPIGIENPEAYYIFTERNHTLQNYNVINQAIKEINLPSNIKKDSEEGLTYMEAHPETEYISILTTLKNKLSDLSSDRLKTYIDKQMSTEEKNALLSDIDAQEEYVLKQAMETINEVRKIQKKPENNKIFDEVEATSYASDFKTLMPTIELVRKDAMVKSQTEFEKIRLLNDQKEKYKKIRERFDWDMKLKRDDFSKGKEAAAKAGIDPTVAEYDWWSAQDLTERNIHIHSLLEGQSGQDVWNTLVSLRKESPGTGNMVLSDALISDLVEEGYISKSQGTQLRKIKTKTNARGEQLMKVGSGGSGSSGGSKGSTAASRLAELKQLSTLMGQRGQAYQRALKIKSPKSNIPKIVFPKAPKMPKIKLAPMTAAPSKFKLKIPKRKSIKTSGKMQSLIRMRK